MGRGATTNWRRGATSWARVGGCNELRPHVSVPTIYCNHVIAFFALALLGGLRAFLPISSLPGEHTRVFSALDALLPFPVEEVANAWLGRQDDDFLQEKKLKDRRSLVLWRTVKIVDSSAPDLGLSKV